jgi:hypothetical protein
MSDAPIPTPPPEPAPAAAAVPAAPAPKPLLRRWWVRLLLVLALLGTTGVVLAFVYRNTLLRRGIETAVTRVTGFPLEIATFDAELLSARVALGGLRLRNPPDFEDPRCLDVPKVVVDMDLESLFGSDIHVQDIDLHVREVVVVKNARGETSLDRLKALGGGGERKPEDPPPEAKRKADAEKGKEPPLKWRCDRLRLRVGKVRYLDYTDLRKDGSPKQETWDLDVDEEFRDLTEPEQVVKILVLEILKGTPLRLVNASVDSLLDGLGGVSNKAGKLLSGAAGAVGGVIKNIGEGIGGVFGIGGEEKTEPEPEPKKVPPKKKK